MTMIVNALMVAVGGGILYLSVCLAAKRRRDTTAAIDSITEAYIQRTAAMQRVITAVNNLAASTQELQDHLERREDACKEDDDLDTPTPWEQMDSILQGGDSGSKEQA